MIELNILKLRLEEYKKQRMMVNLFILYFAGLVFILMVLSMGFIVNKIQMKNLQKNIKKIEANITLEKEKVEYVKEKEQESIMLLKNIEFFSSEYKKRISWAPILSFSGETVPSGIWLERFSSKEKVSQVEDKTQKQHIITIDGYVLPGVANEREAIDRFVRNMSKGILFKRVSLKEVKKEMKRSVDVNAFNIECELKSTGGNN